MTKNWTKEKIRNGFDRFIKEHGRLPKSVEVDQSNYLPSSRWIQLTFGGLEHLRTELGYSDSHFGKGLFRSAIANLVNKRGRDTGRHLETVLKQKFGEVFVHTEKIFDDSKNRVDFYVYSPDGNFGIDVFYPDTLKTMQSNVNIKMKKYVNFYDPLFFVVANEKFTQEELDRYSKFKTNPLPKSACIITMKKLLTTLDNRCSYPNPLHT